MSSISYPRPAGLTKIIGSGSRIEVLGPQLLDPRTVTGLASGYDGSSASNFILNGSDVATWYDEGANGKDISQASASIQPEYDAVNGAVKFDGTGERLVNSAYDSMDGTGDFTILILGFIRDTGSTDEYFVTLAASSDTSQAFACGTRAFLVPPPGTFIYREPPSTSGGELFNGGDTSGALQTIIYRRDHSGDGEYTLRVEGSVVRTATTTVAGKIGDEPLLPSTYLTVGASNASGTLGRYMDGELRQLWLFKRALTQTEMDGISTYFETKK